MTHVKTKFFFIVLVLFIVCAITSAGDAPLKVRFFFTPSCRFCRETKDVVRKAEDRFRGDISIEWIDMSRPGTKAADLLFDMLDEYGVDSALTPELCVFAGNTCLQGAETIIERIEDAIASELAGATCKSEPVHVNRMGLWAVSAAGLADGVNPCAFATVVLLVSMMAAAGRSRRETLVIGAAFTVSVYVTYFAIGLFLYSLLREIRGFLFVSDLVYCAAFGLCVFFGALSLYDAVLVWKRNRPEDMVLQIPDVLKRLMRRSMRTGVHARSLALGTMIAGVIVSLLESVCTGQVYFPVIAGLVRDTATRVRGLFMLAWYNFLFVIPLIAVFVLTLIGIGSDDIARCSRKNVPITKLLLAGVFIAMALWMWNGLAWPLGSR